MTNVWLKRLFLVAFGLAAPFSVATAGTFGSKYEAAGTCGGFPRAAVKTPDWMCLAVVAGPQQGLRFPRVVIDISQPGAVQKRLLITDMGGWTPGLGRVLELAVEPGKAPTVRTLFDKLDVPHGLALGPDRLVYVGERGAIWRFDPKLSASVKDIVLDGLPTAGRHPLKHFVFDKAGNIVLNIGAPSDRCEVRTSELNKIRIPCPESTGSRPEAALWLVSMIWPGGKVKSVAPLATGLRNSMALAVHPQSGLIVQGENSIDLEPEDDPPEELNVVIPGKSYGWPLCVGDNRLLPTLGPRNIDCSSHEKPAVLVPGHAAPLGMLFYDGPMFPELKGKLVMGAHGYRSNGKRIVAYDTEADGRPKQPGDRKTPTYPLVIAGDWGLANGIRPAGAPVGINAGTDGALWFAEDRNQTIMVLLRSSAKDTAADVPEKPVIVAKAPVAIGWAKFYEPLLRVRCSNCHVEFRTRSPRRAWNALVAKGWITPGDLENSKTIKTLRVIAPFPAMPPPDGFLKDKRALAKLKAFLDQNRRKK